MALSANELFSLKWGEFQPFISSSVRNLREVKDFSDVTLVSEDYIPVIFLVTPFLKDNVTVGGLLRCDPGLWRWWTWSTSSHTLWLQFFLPEGEWESHSNVEIDHFCLQGLQAVGSTAPNDIHARGKYLFSFSFQSFIPRSKKWQKCPKNLLKVILGV